MVLGINVQSVSVEHKHTVVTQKSAHNISTATILLSRRELQVGLHYYPGNTQVFPIISTNVIPDFEPRSADTCIITTLKCPQIYELEL